LVGKNGRYYEEVLIQLTGAFAQDGDRCGDHFFVIELGRLDEEGMV
jgi:hypothetical protein